MDERVISRAAAAFAKAMGREATATDRSAVVAALWATMAPLDGYGAGVDEEVNGSMARIEWDSEEDGYGSTVVVFAPGAEFSLEDLSPAMRREVECNIDRADRAGGAA